jgi:DNA-binding NarL/FixJ family response regulator
LATVEKINVLVMGNNPIELSYLFDILKKIKDKNVVTEIAFDHASIRKRLSHFDPSYILIDDNIGPHALRSAVQELITHRKTKHIPITVVKNSNYHEAMNTGVMNYVLKHNLNADSLYQALLNSFKFKRTQLYLLNAYQKRKGQLKEFIRNKFD